MTDTTPDPVTPSVGEEAPKKKTNAELHAELFDHYDEEATRLDIHRTELSLKLIGIFDRESHASVLLGMHFSKQVMKYSALRTLKEISEIADTAPTPKVNNDVVSGFGMAMALMLSSLTLAVESADGTAESGSGFTAVMRRVKAGEDIRDIIDEKKASADATG